jgi:hypothetical protein
MAGMITCTDPVVAVIVIAVPDAAARRVHVTPPPLKLTSKGGA